MLAYIWYLYFINLVFVIGKLSDKNMENMGDVFIGKQSFSDYFDRLLSLLPVIGLSDHPQTFSLGTSELI